MPRLLKSGVADLTLGLFPADREKEARESVYGSFEWLEAYRRHLKSPYWRRVRKDAKARARGACERGDLHPRSRLEVHHRHYRTFGRESLKDVEVLCPGCHQAADQARRREVLQNYLASGEAAQREAAKATYLEKVLSRSHGEEWQMVYYCDPEIYDRKFDEWLERKLYDDWG